MDETNQTNASNEGGGEQQPNTAAPSPPPVLSRRPLMGLPVYFRKGTDEPKPAMVTKVHTETCVDLTVFTGRMSYPVLVVPSAVMVDPAEAGTGWWFPDWF